MILRIQLTQDEHELWATPEGKEQLLKRCRELATGDDIDRAVVHTDNMHQFELAPSSHAKLATRLRELGMRELAALVDPAKNKDDESRAKFADQLMRYGMQYSVAAPAES